MSEITNHTKWALVGKQWIHWSSEHGLVNYIHILESIFVLDMIDYLNYKIKHVFQLSSFWSTWINLFSPIFIRQCNSTSFFVPLQDVFCKYIMIHFKAKLIDFLFLFLAITCIKCLTIPRRKRWLQVLSHKCNC